MFTDNPKGDREQQLNIVHTPQPARALRSRPL